MNSQEKDMMEKYILWTEEDWGKIPEKEVGHYFRDEQWDALSDSEKEEMTRKGEPKGRVWFAIQQWGEGNVDEAKKYFELFMRRSITTFC